MTLTCISRARRVVAALSLPAACASILAACAVGPNFKKPAAPEAAGYTPTPLSTTVAAANTAAGNAQRFVTGSDISADWWTLFHSTALNQLIDLSLANNHDFKAAQAALSVARETVLAQRGVYYPSVAGSFSATRQRQSGQIAPTLNSNA
jgi:outer membrane protein TolC